jgi:parvulin-like peptidyl-prolyl isomerase
VARTRQTSASERRAARAAEERRQRLILYGAIGGLAAVAVIIAIGLYITQYRAPHAHVLTVAGRDYDAAAVARRGSYHAIFEGGIRDLSITSIAERAVDLLVDEAVVRERAPATVGAVSEDDVENDLRERLGFGDSDDRQQFAEALRNVLRASRLTRDEYYDLATAAMLADRLRDGFEEDIGAAAPQVRLSRIRLTDSAAAEEVRATALGGADFAELAAERTADTQHRDDGGDLGWFPLTLLNDEVVEAISGLQAGEIAPIVDSGLFFDVYLVAEREDERELDERQVGQLVAQMFSEWRDVERPAIAVAVDLSDGEERWIADRVAGTVNAALGGGG